MVNVVGVLGSKHDKHMALPVRQVSPIRKMKTYTAIVGRQLESNCMNNQVSQTTLHHLESAKVPSVPLPSTGGSTVDLSVLPGISVVYAYPRTSPADGPSIEGWDEIPGARGCTLQTAEFSTQYSRILESGANRIFGLSTQSTAYQAEMKDRLHVPFDILSDQELKLAGALNLPTFTAGGMTLLTRLTLVLCNGTIDRVFFPISVPKDNPSEVCAYIAARKNR